MPRVLLPDFREVSPAPGKCTSRISFGVSFLKWVPVPALLVLVSSRNRHWVRNLKVNSILIVSRAQLIKEWQKQGWREEEGRPRTACFNNRFIRQEFVDLWHCNDPSKSSSLELEAGVFLAPISQLLDKEHPGEEHYLGIALFLS